MQSIQRYQNEFNVNYYELNCSKTCELKTRIEGGRQKNGKLGRVTPNCDNGL